MKAAILTITDGYNYGNRLQNYAVQQLLVKMGYRALTLRNETYRDIDYLDLPIKDKIINRIKQFPLLKYMKQHICRVVARKKPLHVSKRELAFGEFNRRFITLSSTVYSKHNISSLDVEEFDVFITGSDQVWNPYHGRGTSIDFLQFAPSGKRIALAASFGVNNIPSGQQKQFTHYLNGMKYISVREETGKKIVERLSSKTADVVLDPTMLLSVDEWSKIMQKPGIDIQTHYVLTYFLGDIEDEAWERIKLYASENHCQIINLQDIRNIDTYAIDPSGFVYLIKHSAMFFTDSFHGCVFATLFHKRFAVLKRKDNTEDMFSRIETFVHLFGLHCAVGLDSVTAGIAWEKKYAEVDVVISRERERTLSLFHNALSQHLTN